MFMGALLFRKPAVYTDMSRHYFAKTFCHGAMTFELASECLVQNWTGQSFASLTSRVSLLPGMQSDIHCGHVK